MTAVPPRPAAGDPDFPYMLADTPEEFERVRGIGIGSPPAPDATAVDGLREALLARVGVVNPSKAWQMTVDLFLGTPALRDVLAAAARDAEKVRRCEALADEWVTQVVLDKNGQPGPGSLASAYRYDAAIRIRRALDPS